MKIRLHRLVTVWTFKDVDVPEGIEHEDDIDWDTVWEENLSDEGWEYSEDKDYIECESEVIYD